MKLFILAVGVLFSTAIMAQQGNGVGGQSFGSGTAQPSGLNSPAALSQPSTFNSPAASNQPSPMNSPAATGQPTFNLGSPTAAQPSITPGPNALIFPGITQADSLGQTLDPVSGLPIGPSSGLNLDDLNTSPNNTPTQDSFDNSLIEGRGVRQAEEAEPGDQGTTDFSTFPSSDGRTTP